MRNDEELFSLAEEIVDGNVFGDWMLPKGSTDAVVSTFLVLHFIEKEAIEKMQKDEVVAVYEHLSESGNWSVNGYPTFFSFHSITKDEMNRLKPMIEKIKNARKQVKDEILSTTAL